ncbi:hypothetical protein V2J09_020978 [Rumex salicifolius]
MINAIICFMIIFSSSFFPLQTHAQDTEYFSPDPRFQKIFCNPSSNASLNGNYTKGSTYEGYLNQILDSLIPFSATNYFYSYTQRSGSDQIWTLFYCRYDFYLPECQACVKAAVNKALNVCNVQKEAVVVYEQCTLHYANRNIASLEEEDLVVAWQPSVNNVSMDVKDFYNIVLENLAPLVNQKAYNSSKETMYYGTLIRNITSAYNLYALAQCTPDITAAECGRCLKGCVNSIPASKEGRDFMRLFQPSCQVTYSVSLFFRVKNNGSAPSPVPSDSSPVSPKTGKSATFYITRAVIPAVVGILFLLAVWFCLTKRRQSPEKSRLNKNTRG